jgi:hypothetical protein
MHTFIPHELWIRNIELKKKSTSGAQNVLGWEIVLLLLRAQVFSFS